MMGWMRKKDDDVRYDTATLLVGRRRRDAFLTSEGGAFNDA